MPTFGFITNKKSHLYKRLFYILELIISYLDLRSIRALVSYQNHVPIR